MYTNETIFTQGPHLTSFNELILVIFIGSVDRQCELRALFSKHLNEEKKVIGNEVSNNIVSRMLALNRASLILIQTSHMVLLALSVH